MEIYLADGVHLVSEVGVYSIGRVWVHLKGRIWVQSMGGVELHSVDRVHSISGIYLVGIVYSVEYTQWSIFSWVYSV